jgi:hypothetical protein
MEYKKASEIRNTGLLSLIAKNKFEKEKGLGAAIGSAISDKFKAKATGIKEKFDPLNIVRGITGKGTFGKIATTIAGRALGKSEKDISYFGGYTRKSKLHQHDTNISYMEDDVDNGQTSSGPVVGVLTQMYEFMQKTHEVDKKETEIQQAFLEEQSSDAETRHKELIKAIKSYMKVPKGEKPDKEDGGGIFDWIMNIINKIKDGIMEIVDKAISALKFLIAPLLSFLGMLGSGALSLLGTLGAFLMTPLGVAFLTAVAAGTVASWIAKQIAEDPHAALRGEGPVGTAVAGPGAETQLPTYEKEQSNKSLISKANEVDKKGIQNASLEELEAKQQLMVEYGDPRARVKSGKGDESDKIKAKQLDDIETEISTRKSKQAPASPSTNEKTEASNPTAVPSQNKKTEPSSPTVTPSAPTSVPTAPVIPKNTPIPEKAESSSSDSGSNQPIVAVNNSTNNIGGSKPKMFNLDSIKMRNDDLTIFNYRNSVVV